MYLINPSSIGKTLADARGDIFRGLEVVEGCSAVGHLSMGETAGGLSRGLDTYSYRQPLGVTAGICPFNFPVMIPLWMFPLSIVCGNRCMRLNKTIQYLTIFDSLCILLSFLWPDWMNGWFNTPYWLICNTHFFLCTYGIDACINVFLSICMMNQHGVETFWEGPGRDDDSCALGTWSRHTSRSTAGNKSRVKE